MTLFCIYNLTPLSIWKVTFSVIFKRIVDWKIILQLVLQTKPDADPALFINPEQPLIASTTISNEDIDRQEARVLEMRKKLSEAIESLSGWTDFILMIWYEWLLMNSHVCPLLPYYKRKEVFWKFDFLLDNCISYIQSSFSFRSLQFA